MAALDRLKPMDLRDLLDETFDLYKSNFRLFLTVSAVLILPVQTVFFYLVSESESTDLSVDAAVASDFITVGLASLALFSYFIAVGALTRAVSDSFLGRPGSVRASLASMFKHPLKLLYTLFLTLLILGLFEFLALIIPLFMFGVILASIGISGETGNESAPMVLTGLGIFAVISFLGLWVASLFVFTLPAFVLEGKSGIAALRRSTEIFLYNKKKASGSLLLMTMLTGAVVTILSALLVGLTAFGFSLFFPSEEGTIGLQDTVSGALFGVAQVVALPLWLIFVILTYYDVRIRKEGFDLEMMAEELSAGDGMDARINTNDPPPTEHSPAD